ncbi:DUF4872 domain-containing protein [Microbispora sp. CA-102843]|uniref:DUF4872 domain-containing protein n=1 Tax=Microbispora sp. CA-102843 TaxID=3239952 RepID=UPI003D900119
MEAAGRTEEALVLDTRPEPERLPLAAFMAAWSSLKKERHHLVSVPASAGAGAPRGDLDAAVREAVGETVARLTGPVLGNAFDVNFGLSGMRRLAAQLAARRGTGWTRRFADPRAFHAAMIRLYECLEIEYTAPGATRPLYAAFLDEAAGLLGGTACGQAGRWTRPRGSRRWTTWPRWRRKPYGPRRRPWRRCARFETGSSCRRDTAETLGVSYAGRS